MFIVRKGNELDKDITHVYLYQDSIWKHMSTFLVYLYLPLSKVHQPTPFINLVYSPLYLHFMETSSVIGPHTGLGGSGKRGGQKKTCHFHPQATLIDQNKEHDVLLTF